MVKYGILGGGWAGILSAIEIKKHSSSAQIEILEKNEQGHLGGLLRSQTIEGFTYDTGGPHILFSKDKETLNAILKIMGENWKQMERKNFIHFENMIIPYPFENGIFMLPPEERAEIGMEIIENLFHLKNNSEWMPETFYDWIYGIFGKNMGSRYLEPYNNKIWKRNLKEFDASWVFTPGRLPLPELRDIVFSVSGIPTVGYKEQANFYYPKVGGIQSLYESLLEKAKQLGIKILAGCEVKRVQRDKEGGWIINGEYRYDRILSTLPLPELINITDAKNEIKAAAKKLDYNRVIVIGFALNQPAPDRITLYVPRTDIIFHRYTWMSNLVSQSPEGKSNLIVEITVPQNEKIEVPKFLENSIEGLMKLGVIEDRTAIIHSKVWVHEYGYPVYTMGHNKIREAIFEYLMSEKIVSVGRWGSWHYWNTDKVYEAVMKYSSLILG